MTVDYAFDEKKRRFRMFKKRVSPLDIFKEAELSQSRLKILLEGKDRASLQKRKPQSKNPEFLNFKTSPISKSPLSQQELPSYREQKPIPVLTNIQVESDNRIQEDEPKIKTKAIHELQEETPPVSLLKKDLETELDYIIKYALENPTGKDDRSLDDVDPQLLDIVKKVLFSSERYNSNDIISNNKINTLEPKLESLYSRDKLDNEFDVRSEFGMTNAIPKKSYYPTIESEESLDLAKDQIKYQVIKLLEDTEKKSNLNMNHTPSGLQELENQLKGSLEKIKKSQQSTLDANSKN